MRPIKFRAWDRQEKRWFGRSSIYLSQTDGDGKPVFVFDPRNSERLEFEQFTGLKDKNGRDIYEGDVVKVAPNDQWKDEVEEGFLWVVTWSGDIAGFSAPWKGDGTFEVIGNVHENPELLANDR